MDINQFFFTIEKDHLILTANRRLSQYLRNRYDRWQQESGQSTWQTLNALPLSRWIEQLWDDQPIDNRPVLTDFQELLIFEEIIAGSVEEGNFLNPTETARLVQQTFRLIYQWELLLRDPAYLSSFDKTFTFWLKQFENKCDNYQVVSRSMLMYLIKKLMINNPTFFSFPASLYFIGFDELTPAITSLQTCLADFSSIHQVQLETTTRLPPLRTSLLDHEHELEAVARWAYQTLLSDPQALIGCVLPTLTSSRKTIYRIFHDVYYAEGLSHHYPSPPINISAANALSAYPIIHLALKILSLNNAEMLLEDFSALLRSPFLHGGESEIHKRALLDAALRSFGELSIDLRKLLSAKWQTLGGCSILNQQLQKFFSLVPDLTLTQSLDQWATLFVAQLRIFGWPGERTLDSQEFQLVERFKKLLSEYVVLDKFVSAITFNQALMLLHKLAQMTLFQINTENMPIQILGMLEAGGIEFDHLWVAGLDNEKWPAPANPNPFIPLAIQRQLGMPHSSATREYSFSLGLTQRLCQNAKKIIFSHAASEGDKPLSPSALIVNLPFIEWQATGFSLIKKIAQTTLMERYREEFVPLKFAESITGGSAVLKAQAACPFQAFAMFRLHASPLDDLSTGLAYHERGSLVHAILATIWKTLGTHETLISTDTHKLEQHIDEAIEIAFSFWQQKKIFVSKDKLISIEKKRLKRLLRHWLMLEKSRPPFTVISCEERRQVNIGKLALSIVIDRIDRLADGSQVIIDYKTGRSAISDWFSTRPSEPQLPLYYVLSDEMPSALLFAQVRQDGMFFNGLTQIQHHIPGAMTLNKIRGELFENWEEMVAHWRSTLHQLADDFSCGVTTVDPKNAITCQRCGLQSLCRVNSFSDRASSIASL